MTESKYVAWRKSSYSSGTGNCVEVTSTDRLVAVRDTKQNGRGPLLRFTEATWRRFLAQAKDGKAFVNSPRDLHHSVREPILGMFRI